MSNRLKNLADAGVSIWLDDLSRDRLDSGNLADLVADPVRHRRDHQPHHLRRSPEQGHRYDAQVASWPPAGVDPRHDPRLDHR